MVEQFGQDVKERINRDDRSSPMMKNHGEQEAENILSAGCRHCKLTEIELLLPRRGGLTRASVAWRIWRETRVAQRWLAERMGLRSPANASDVVRRFEATDDSELVDEILD